MHKVWCFYFLIINALLMAKYFKSCAKDAKFKTFANDYNPIANID